jgi:(p)ppGpp synthase/HD superfamily hydrolase
MKTMLARAIQIAAEAHDGQVDKAGLPYILHPLTLLARVGDQADEDTRIVAVLHDVLEDSAWTAEGLADEGFSHDVILSLNALTHVKGESYKDYIRRLQNTQYGGIARYIKKLDLEHNLEIMRVAKAGELEDHDLRRMRKYVAAWRELAGYNDQDDGVAE